MLDMLSEVAPSIIRVVPICHPGTGSEHRATFHRTGRSPARHVRILSQRGPNARVADAMTTMVPTIGYRRRLRRHVHLAGENRTSGGGGRRRRAVGRPSHPRDRGGNADAIMKRFAHNGLASSKRS